MYMNILSLQELAGTKEDEGHGASMSSLRSQMKLITEDLSNVTSEGALGKRQPESRESEYSTVSRKNRGRNLLKLDLVMRVLPSDPTVASS